MAEREQTIRERAYAIWEEEGRPEGREREHWARASREIEAEESPGALSNDSAAPTAPVGAASGLEPGGTKPGGGPGAGAGSIGTGGGSTGGASTGSVKKRRAR